MKSDRVCAVQCEGGGGGRGGRGGRGGEGGEGWEGGEGGGGGGRGGGGEGGEGGGGEPPGFWCQGQPKSIVIGGGETSPPDLGAHFWVHTEVPPPPPTMVVWRGGGQWGGD